MKILATTSPVPGETEFLPMPFEVAEKIATHFYDVKSIIPIHEAVKNQRHGYAILTRGGHEAIVATMRHPELGELPAILHKTLPLRRIEFLDLELPQLSPGAGIASEMATRPTSLLPRRSSKANYKVCVNYVTVKGISMMGKTFSCISENETHVELSVVATGERVVFTKNEVL